MKPVPPKDLWSQLASIREHDTPPDGSFSTNDYASRFSMSNNTAYRELMRRCRAGQIKRAGVFSGEVYFTLS